MKICKYCGKTFGPRANSEICFECMPSGLTAAQRNTIKKKLERQANPIILKCPCCEKNFELPFGEINRKYCFECVPSGLTKKEQGNRIRFLAKMKMVNMLGGKCCLCGFNKYQSALEFHHINEDSKEFNISHRVSSFELNDEILKELDKCVLLCSNCHRALHANEITGIKIFDKIKKI